MAHSIHMIRCEPYLVDPVTVRRKILRYRRTGDRIGRQYNNARMVLAQPDLVFGADHPLAFQAADLCRAHGYRFALERVYGSTHRGYHYFLPGGHIVGAANDLQRLRAAGIHAGDLQFVGIRMLAAFQHFSNDQSLQSATYAFIPLQAFHFEPDGCEYCRQTLRFQWNSGMPRREVIVQPMITDLHTFGVCCKYNPGR